MRIRQLCERGNRRAFFNTARRALHSDRVIPPICCEDGRVACSDYDKSVEFLKVFASNYSWCPSSAAHTQLAQIDVESAWRLSRVLFHPAVIDRVISELGGKSSGPDELPLCFYKKSGWSVRNLLGKMFTVCLVTGQVPSVWRKAFVTPIFKGKGSTSDAKGYRPISVTCVAAKILERCLLPFIVSHLTNANVVPVQQFGSLPKRSVTVQLITSFYRWARLFDNNVPFDVMFLDFVKAFDRVDREILLQRLSATGIHSSVARLIRGLFTNRSHVVRVGSSFSPSASVPSGVVQGTVLGPILFIIYTSVVPRIVRPLSCYMFVDDTKVFGEVSSLSDGYGFQQACSSLETWCSECGLSLAPEKCRVLQVGCNNPGWHYVLSGSEAVTASAHPDLGVMMSDTLNFSSHCGIVSKKALGMTYAIRRTFHGCNRDTMMLAFNTYVAPVLMFASPVWSPFLKRDIHRVEKPLRMFSKSLPGLCGMTYPDRLRVLGIHSFEWRRVENDLVLAFKILNSLVFTDPTAPFCIQILVAPDVILGV